MKYWTYMKGEVPGSYEPDALAALPGFTMTTLVCPGEGEIAEKNWRRAGEFDDIVRALDAHQAQTPPAAPLGARTGNVARVPNVDKRISGMRRLTRRGKRRRFVRGGRYTSG